MSEGDSEENEEKFNMESFMSITLVLFQYITKQLLLYTFTSRFDLEEHKLLEDTKSARSVCTLLRGIDYYI